MKFRYYKAPNGTLWRSKGPWLQYYIGGGWNRFWGYRRNIKDFNEFKQVSEEELTLELI